MLIVDDFGVEYVGRKYAEHLASVLNKFHEISEDWEGKKISGVDLIWDYIQKHSDRTCRLSMKSYTEKLLFKVGHKPPFKKQISPHRCRDITYVRKVQQTPEEDSSPALDEKGVLRVQRIVGALLYFYIAVNNKLLVALSKIGAHQASATDKTLKSINQLLDYCATYPDDGIVYLSSDMILTAHSDAGFNNETKARSRSGAHIFLSENEPIPRWNEPILTVS